ncbi:small nuclear ribonucleoprotein component-like protein [Verticillium dahliae VDG1]|nr:small nuclear ribonucleoprotein component-like protein [Verticillium dahliae VDG1]
MVRRRIATDRFSRPDEFAARALPPSLDLYTWPSCTLDELAHQLAAERPALLPDPAVGTRLAFRLIFPDARSMDNASHTAPRFMVKDLGSVVIGDGGPGLDVAAADDATDEADRVWPVRQRGGIKDGLRTLEGSKFVVGDYVSWCRGAGADPSYSRRTLGRSSDASRTA